MKTLMLIALLALTTACSETTRIESKTPNGYFEDTTQKNPFSKTRTVKNVTDPDFRDCRNRNSPTMGSSGADMYCRSQTSGNGAGLGYGGPGFAPVLVQPGGAAPLDRRFYNGMPGAANIMIGQITPDAAISLEHHPGSTIQVMVPNGASDPGNQPVSQRDMEDVWAELEKKEPKKQSEPNNKK